MLLKMLPYCRALGRGQTLKLKYGFMQVPKFDSEKDYYQILEVSQDASESEIKKSYFRLAKVYHPDSNQGFENKFKEINEAYYVLSNPDIKKDYESSRYWSNFSQNMGDKFKNGKYNKAKQDFQSLSDEEKQLLKNQFKRYKRRFLMVIGGVLLFILVFVRKNHKYFVEYNGKLVPVQYKLLENNKFAFAPINSEPISQQTIQKFQQAIPVQNQQFGQTGISNYSLQTTDSNYPSQTQSYRMTTPTSAGFQSGINPQTPRFQPYAPQNQHPSYAPYGPPRTQN